MLPGNFNPPKSLKNSPTPEEMCFQFLGGNRLSHSRVWNRVSSHLLDCVALEIAEESHPVKDRVRRFWGKRKKRGSEAIASWETMRLTGFVVYSTSRRTDRGSL